MSARTRTVGIGIAIVVVAGLAALVWYLTRDTVAEVDIGATSDSATPSADAANVGSADVGSADDLAGEWTITNTDGGDLEQGTFVGYRVDEELAGIGAATAVGRTAAVDGTMTIESGGTVSGVTIDADVSRLESDQAFRDRAIGDQGLETRQFPDAGFTLDESFVIPEEALSGETVTIPATGTLTLHGVDQQVTVDLEARLLGDQILAGGSIPIAMSDFDITPPSAQRVISIAEDGTAELQLFFERATQ
jgi:polyisoprenoid-binding protein YceI